MRSYHPHYLISLSYPRPMSSHIYYGEVVGNRPLFLYSDVEQWHPDSISKLVINGVEFTDSSAKYFLLRREEEFHYMLAIQVENSFPIEIHYTMQVHQRVDHYLILCQFQNRTEAFVIYLTQNGRLIELVNELGIGLNIRNESGGSARNNWLFSRNVRWTGRHNWNPQNTNFTGFLLEIEYRNR